MLLGQEVSKLEMPDEVVENYTWQWMWKVYTASHYYYLFFAVCCSKNIYKWPPKGKYKPIHQATNEKK